MKKMTYGEFCTAMREFNKQNGHTRQGNKKLLEGVVVFTEDSFTKPYTEKERSYQTDSDQKAFLPDMISNSIFGDCLDGKDLGVRLDLYIYDSWKVDYCYLLNN